MKRGRADLRRKKIPGGVKERTRKARKQKANQNPVEGENEREVLLPCSIARMDSVHGGSHTERPRSALAGRVQSTVGSENLHICLKGPVCCTHLEIYNDS